jgi:hypothetical protein
MAQLLPRVTEMITEGPFPDDLRPALGCVNNRPKRTARWPERWIIHKADGSFALYLVNWEIPSAANFLSSVIRIPELTVPQVLTAVTSPPSVNEGSRFLEWLHP